MVNIGIQSNCCCNDQGSGSCCNVWNEEYWGDKYYFSTIGKLYYKSYACDCARTVKEGTTCNDSFDADPFLCNPYQTPGCTNCERKLVCTGSEIELYASGAILRYPNRNLFENIPNICGQSGQDFPCFCDLCPKIWNEDPKFSWDIKTTPFYWSPEIIPSYCPPTINGTNCDNAIENLSDLDCTVKMSNYIGPFCLCKTTPSEYRTRIFGTITTTTFSDPYGCEGGDEPKIGSNCLTPKEIITTQNFDILALAYITCECSSDTFIPCTINLCDGSLPTSAIHVLTIKPLLAPTLFPDTSKKYVDANTLEVIEINNFPAFDSGFKFVSYLSNIVDPESGNWEYIGGSIPVVCKEKGPFNCADCYPTSCGESSTGDPCFKIENMPGWDGSNCLGKNSSVCCCYDQGDEFLGCANPEIRNYPTLLISKTSLD